MTRRANSGSEIAPRPAENLTRWDPWAEMESTRRQMDELIGRLFGYSPASRLIPGVPGRAINTEFTFAPDIYETSDEFVFVFAVPGFTPDDLKIEATADRLSIHGERKPFYANENAAQLYRSWWSAGQGNFQFSYSLPCEIDPNKVQANYRNGMLELHLPKAEAVKPKPVKVNVTGE
jgi:HSP20 family protein